MLCKVNDETVPYLFISIVSYSNNYSFNTNPSDVSSVFNGLKSF